MYLTIGMQARTDGLFLVKKDLSGSEEAGEAQEFYYFTLGTFGIIIQCHVLRDFHRAPLHIRNAYLGRIFTIP
jgi:hypothetical protein